MFKSKRLKHRPIVHGDQPDILGYLESTGLICGVNVDPSGTLLHPSEELKKFLGWDLQDVQLQNFFDIVPPEEQSRFAALITQTLQQGHPHDANLDLLVGHSKGSVLVPSHIIFVPPPFLNFTPEAAQTFLRLLLMKRFDAQVLTPADIQNHKLFNLGSLAAGVAHDLNNLFTGMGAFTSLLSHRIHAPQLKKYLGAIESTLDKATHLTQTILDSLKHDEDDQALVDPVRCLKEICYLAERTIDEGIQFSVLLPDRSLPVKIKGSELSQVILNLIVNAKEALHGRGNIVVSADYQPDPQPDIFCLNVEDSGQGISIEDQSRIFDPFFTTKGDAGGTGLGLSVIHKIITQADGTISVESAPGKGSRFSVQLPIIR